MAKKKPEEKPKVKKNGRPEDYTEAKAEEICLRLAQGDSLNAICKEEGMPSRKGVYRWLVKHESFRHNYTLAKEYGVECMLDDLVEIADQSDADSYLDENGRARTDHEVVARSRLRIDTRKWVIVKLAPRKYGSKVTTDTDGTLTIVNALQI